MIWLASRVSKLAYNDPNSSPLIFLILCNNKSECISFKTNTDFITQINKVIIVIKIPFNRFRVCPKNTDLNNNSQHSESVFVLK